MESTSNASLTTAKKVNDVRKGDIILFDSKYPCKIISISISKTGKHGHAKAAMVGIDIFTGKKHEGVFPTSHSVEEVVVNVEKYSLLNITDDDYLSLLLDGSDKTKEDFKLNRDNENDCGLIEMFEKLKDGELMYVNILTAMDMEKIHNYALDTN